MPVAFHYAVKVKLIRYETKDEIDFINYEKVFENENPIIAREEAFEEYEAWIKDLYTGMGKTSEYTTDKKARIDLQKFITLSDKDKVEIGETEIDYINLFSYGIGVYLVINGHIDKPNTYLELGKNLLHGIGTPASYDNLDIIIMDLSEEFKLYQHYNYNTKNKEIEIVYCSRDEWEEGFREDEPYTYKIIETPFDWSGYDKPYWWGEPKEESTNELFERIIENGEGEVIEFKPTLSYHFTKKTWQGKYEVNYKIAKAICAFLNSKGGLLFIGVTDKGEPQGLDFDFNLADKENKFDYFKLDFDRILENFIGIFVKPIVNIEFIEVKGKQICVVKVDPSKEPVFLIAEESKKEFWVRGNASNRQITDLDKIVSYLSNRQQNLNDTK
jgi:hypothetical protein